MPRTWYINGESMVQVVGPSGSLIAGGGQQLGLAVDQITVTQTIHSEPLIADAYGKRNPADEQVFGGEAVIAMNLIHFNPTALSECLRLSFPAGFPTAAGPVGTAGSPAEGALGRAGATRGGGAALLAATNSYIRLNITSPIAGLPYNFPSAYLRDEPYHFPLGAEKSVVRLIWKALAYSVDPWNGGTGSLGAVLFNRVALTAPNTL